MALQLLSFFFFTFVSSFLFAFEFLFIFVTLGDLGLELELCILHQHVYYRVYEKTTKRFSSSHGQSKL